MENKLPKAPLQEVIFEARWELVPDSTGRYLTDPGYNFALGKFRDLIKKDFPFYKPLASDDLPVQLMNYQTIHQFWKDANKWPVIQFGPGIITVNDVEGNYVWETKYLPLVRENINNLIKAYDELTFLNCSLRYIDVVKVADYGFTTWEEFLKKHINFSFENNFNKYGDLSNFQFNQSFNINDVGTLLVNFSSGQNNKKETLFIWQTEVSINKKFKKTELLDWLEKAHNCTSSVFKDICKKEFYDSFSK